MEHTKGPWKVEVMDKFGKRPSYGALNIRSDDCRTIAKVFPQLPTESSANAHLIAAAPDMLETLYDISFYIDDNEGPRAIQLRRQIAYLIAKAEGK